MSAIAPVSAHVVLVLTACVLFYAAFTDLKRFRIDNELVVTLAGLFILHAVLSGRWIFMYWNIGFAALMFLVMLYFYAQKLMGGGDLKLLTAAFLWTGIDCALIYSIVLLLLALGEALAAQRGWINAQIIDGRKRVPFGPAIAGSLIIVFLLGCLNPT